MRLTNIQVLRFIAAAAVVFFHGLRTGETYFVDRHSAIFGVFEYGFVGVDLFFAISGFIIFYTVTRSQVSRGQFLLHRAERIAPIYWCATFAMLALILAFPGLFRPREGWGTLANLLQSLSFTTFWTDSMALIYVGWSLEFEVLFYLCVGIFLGSRVSPWTVVPVVFAILVAVGAVTGVQAAPLKFFTSPLLLEFLFGVLAAQAYMRLPPSRPVLVAVVVATLALVWADPWSRAIWAGIPSAVLVYCGARFQSPRTGAVTRVLSSLGDASYSIYLVQVFTISAIAKLWVRAVPASPLDLVILVTSLATIAAGWLVYVTFERPMLRMCRRVSRPRPPVLAGAQ